MNKIFKFWKVCIKIENEGQNIFCKDTFYNVNFTNIFFKLFLKFSFQMKLILTFTLKLWLVLHKFYEYEELFRHLPLVCYWNHFKNLKVSKKIIINKIIWNLKLNKNENFMIFSKINFIQKIKF